MRETCETDEEVVEGGDALELGEGGERVVGGLAERSDRSSVVGVGEVRLPGEGSVGGAPGRVGIELGPDHLELGVRVDGELGPHGGRVERCAFRGDRAQLPARAARPEWCSTVGAGGSRVQIESHYSQGTAVGLADRVPVSRFFSFGESQDHRRRRRQRSAGSETAGEPGAERAGPGRADPPNAGRGTTKHGPRGRKEGNSGGQGRNRATRKRTRTHPRRTKRPPGRADRPA